MLTAPPYTGLNELLAQLKRRRLYAEVYGTPEAAERADLDWAAVAIHACDVAAELGLQEPPGVRCEADDLVQRIQGGGAPAS